MPRTPKKQTLSVDQRLYTEMVDDLMPRPRYLRNAAFAFCFGGLVSLIGQAFTDFYKSVFHLDAAKADSPAVATMILLAALLTGLGLFDKISKYAGAGLAVPVTGFANSMVSEALEFKREGLVHGVGGKMFALAGSVIAFGVVTAFVIGLIYAIFVY